MTKIIDKIVKSKYPPKQTNVTWIDTSVKPYVSRSYINGSWEVVGGGVTDYEDIKNKPTINGVELDGNKTSQELGVYSKPSSGIPQSDLSSDVQSQLNKHFKGWYNTLEELKAAHTATDGDSAYVKDASPATTWSIYVYDSTASSDKYWADSGTDADTSNVQTFESGEEVNETYIDDTHLANPKIGALPTATDVMKLNQKLRGITLSETKQSIDGAVEGEYVKGADGSISSSVSSAYVEYALGSSTKVRFLGLFTKTSATGGFALGHYDNGTWVTDFSTIWDYDSSLSSNKTKEYVISVPDNATHFRTTCRGSSDILNLSNFYCYLEEGESTEAIVDAINGKTQYVKLAWVNGSINSNGIIDTNSSYRRSVAIPVKRNDVVVYKTSYTGAGTAIGMTDENVTYCRPLKQHTDSHIYNVTIDYDGYIVVTRVSSSSENPTLSITSSMSTQLLGEGYDYSDETIVIDANDKINRAYNTIDANQQNADFTSALFDREKMLAEIASMTNSDILVQGSCGYDDSGQDVVDDTIHWEIYKNGILYIHGYGKFYDFIKGTGACLTKTGVNAQVSSLMEAYPEQHLWYYGFVYGNLNNITPPYASPDEQVYDNTANPDVMVYANKRYVPFGETTNPLNNKPYGYSSPWYIYRTDVDWGYQSKSAYDANNPNGIKYNRVCIEEDTSNGRGGITYIGNWTFYRVTADSLVLPEHVTKIGCWGVRYSPVIKTVVMGDSITEIEDHGVSRMLNMRSCKISSALQTFGYAGMESNLAISRIAMPSNVVSIGKYMFNGCSRMNVLSLGDTHLTSIPNQVATSNILNGYVSIPDGVTLIGNNAFYNSNLTEVKIPTSVTNIGTDAFRRCFNLNKVILNSTAISSGMSIDTGVNGTEKLKQGALFGYCDWILIPSENTISSWFYRFFREVKDDGEYKWFRRLTNKLSS